MKHTGMRLVRPALLTVLISAVAIIHLELGLATLVLVALSTGDDARQNARHHGNRMP